MSSIRIKAKDRKGLVDVKCLMKHNMETGLRKDKSGKKIPEHWIQDVSAEANGQVVFSCRVQHVHFKRPVSRVRVCG
jgi:sulfur-oxidizing protein SoxZ